MGACGGKSQKSQSVIQKAIPDPSTIDSKKITQDKNLSSTSTGLQSNSQQLSKEVSSDPNKNQAKEQPAQVEITIIPTTTNNQQNQNQKAATNSTEMGSLVGIANLVSNLPQLGNDNNNYSNNNNNFPKLGANLNQNANKITMNPFKNENEAPSNTQLPHLNVTNLQSNNNQNVETDSKEFSNQIQAIDSNNFSIMIPSAIQKEREGGLRYATQQMQLTSELNVPGVNSVESKYI